MLLLSSMTVFTAAAVPIVQQPFERTWTRTDQPVASSNAVRTWIWGPAPFTAAMWEPYAESPDELRQVQYFDKSRMEITQPGGDQSSIWYVTNGLIAKELITGEMQLGDNEFETRTAANVNVAGDPDDSNGPTYASFSGLLNAPATNVGATLTNRVNRNGSVTSDPALAAQNVTVAHFAQETNHAIAKPFWDFMNSSGTVSQNGSLTNAPLFESPYFATGLPITEAYWANVQVGGTPREVLMQCFERRCLTYTPQNPAEWQVEMGNVGQHYYRWRYETELPTEPPAMTVTGDQMSPLFLIDWPVDGDDDAWILLSNDSPVPITIQLDGPVSRTISLPACDGCIVWPSPQSFPGCADDTPYDEVLLPPGNYRAVVTFHDAQSDNLIAHWTLVPNADYGMCYYRYNTPN